MKDPRWPAVAVFAVLAISVFIYLAAIRPGQIKERCHELRMVLLAEQVGADNQGIAAKDRRWYQEHCE